MDKIRIHGGASLAGTIAVSGAKNAALPLMAACLLTSDRLTLTNVPTLADITTLARLLAELGVEVDPGASDLPAFQPNSIDRPLQGKLALTAADISSTTAPYDLVRKMRASVLVLGPLLARFGRARVSLPGGCAIGPRPVDLHLKALTALGATIELADGYIEATAPQGLRATTIRFPFVSVGATENALMATTLAYGTSIIENAAREPEIGDLARCLVAMGADIEGIGSDRLIVRGVATLHGATYAIVPDRIETGTYAMAAGITGGTIELLGATLDHILVPAQLLAKAGVELAGTNRGVTARPHNGRLKSVDADTQPYPGFPTDLQAQFMALMAVADGRSIITENIFENRFMHVPELARMGARITVKGATAVVTGTDELIGAPVMATDLRASVSLVLAGLAARGTTTISRIYHLDRGYDRLVEKLVACGATIDRIEDNP
ncbi:MAG: UDP-N-acetylglucosamine 1-carboxyvinyltransferase [Alphaproteobacteria bacterium]|nr:UDP-N-acetylglucosamine 1-carboxyvinyltransferase [Alphaproteobacteria bacterium]